MDSTGSALIIVPCLNEAAHLPQLLATLKDDPGCYRIVVVDGGSTDGSQAVVASAAQVNDRITILDNPKRIQSAAVNLAVDRFGTGHNWLVRVDAHCRYPPGYVSRLLAAAAQTGSDSVVVPMVTDSLGGCFQRGVARAQNSVLGTGGSAHRHIRKGTWVEHGHHALMRISTFAKAGGYDEAFRANEDAELDVRIVSTGGTIWLEPSAAITYFPRADPKSLWLQYFRYGRGRAMTFQRHRQRLRVRQVLPLGVLPSLALACLGAVLVPLGLLLALPALTWAIGSVAYGVLLGVRERSWCVASSGLTALIMHVAWSGGFWAQIARSDYPRSTSPELNAARSANELEH